MKKPPDLAITGAVLAALAVVLYKGGFERGDGMALSTKTVG